MMTFSTNVNEKDKGELSILDFLNTKSFVKMSVAFCLLFSMAVLIPTQIAAQATFIDKNGNVLEEEGETVHKDDSLALVAFYHALDGPNWFNNAGWLEDGVEFWHGIDRVEEIDDDEWRVTRIDIRENFLQGELPEEIGMMVHLERFGFRDNYIHGNIPTEIADMESLQRLDARRNIFSGVPPWEEMVSLPDLERIHINRNHFEGEVPSVVGDFPRMERVEMYGNLFTGPIPPEWSQVETMQRLRMGDAYHTGTIPEEFGDFPDLRRFQVNGVPLMDLEPFPEWFRDMADHLERIRLRGAQIEGPIPDWINELYKLERLMVGGGEFSGEIPNMTFLTNLDRLLLDDADFTGPIPEWMGEMPALERLELIDVNISGPIPDNLANAPSLERLDWRNLDLEGPMPDMRNLNLDRLELENIGFDLGEIPEWVGTQGRLDRIIMADMGVSGEIPEFLSQLEALTRFEFPDNPELTGDVPQWLRNIDDLERFDISRTGIDVGDEIPVWLADKTQLTHLGLAGHELSGELPNWISDFIVLEQLMLDDNEFTGEIPEFVGSFALLDSLNLANNQFSGEIPVSLADAGKIGPVTLLSRLDISGNENLTGPVPMEFTNWDTDVFRVFHFDETDLCEPDNETFRTWLEEVDYQINPQVYTSVRSTGVLCSDVSAEDPYAGRPYRFALHQSYPNPFNPTTTIKYEVPFEEQEQVTLRVYDLLGKHVATLVNEVKTAGSYEVTFDAENLASGTYIYRLEAGNMSQTQSMMLIK